MYNKAESEIKEILDYNKDLKINYEFTYSLFNRYMINIISFEGLVQFLTYFKENDIIRFHLYGYSSSHKGDDSIYWESSDSDLKSIVVSIDNRKDSSEYIGSIINKMKRSYNIDKLLG